MQLIALVATLSLSAGLLQAQAEGPGSVSWQPLSSRTYDGRPIEGQTGRFVVPEDRALPGRTISLGLIRLPSTAAHPGDPIVFLMGGPGIPASVMLPISPYFDLFDRLRAGSDVILIDQRGIGQSEPVLSCPASSDLPADFLESYHDLLIALRAVATQCLAEWQGRGVHVAAYNTQESSDDLESLRLALGANRLNLLAFSYGTHLALSYARRHPDRVGRMVLEGVRGPDQSLKSPLVYDRGFRRISAIAAGDSVASRLTPDLAALLATLLGRLESRPVTVTVSNRQGDPLELVIGNEGLQALVSNAIDDPRLPAMLATLSQGDSTLLAVMAAAAFKGFAEVNLMARAVDCASGSSEAARHRVAVEVQGALLGNPIPNLVRSEEYCSVFGAITLPDEFRRPIRSNAPTLFLSGELDVVAPAADAAAIASGFPNSVQLVVKNGMHELLPVPGVQQAVVDFFAGKDVTGRELAAEAPHWLTVEQAKAPPRRR